MLTLLMPNETTEKIVTAHQILGGTNMTQRTLKAGFTNNVNLGLKH